MGHSEIEELLSAFADGELVPAQQEVVELHLSGCSDCQRALAEFRLTRQHLALLADPFGLTWRPDVVGRVTARINRRRRWASWSRRLAVNAVSALAVGALLLAGLWLLQHLPTMLPQDGASAAATDANETRYAAAGRWFNTVSSNTTIAVTYFEVPNQPGATYTSTRRVLLVEPAGTENLEQTSDPGRYAARRVWIKLTDAGAVLTGAPESISILKSFGWPTDTLSPNSTILVTYAKVSDPLTTLALPTDDGRFTLYLHLDGADLYVGPTASNVLSNLVFDLSLDYTEDLFVVLERPDGTQVLLDPPSAPNLAFVPLPPNARPGDRMRLFLWVRGGDHSPVAEFTLKKDANGNWFAAYLEKQNVTPSLKVALPPPKGNAP